MKKPLIILVTPAPTSNRTSEENLGLAYLASVCREQNAEVIIIDGWLEGLEPSEIAKKIMMERLPLFIGFSCYQLNRKNAMEIIEILKSENYKVPFLAGGFGPTFNPEEFLDSGFDFVSIAESEEMIVDLCKYFIYGKPDISQISGIAYYDDKKLFYNKPRLITDLDKIPFPSRDTIHHAIKSKTPVNIITSRGCTGNCTFCSVAAFWRLGDGPVWRGRSVINIVDELEQLYKLGARHFKFVDDSFIESPRDEEWCISFAGEIQKRGLDIRMRISLRADKVSDEIISILKRAGCNSIACGIESFNIKALERMGKKADPEQNIKVLDIFKKYNIYVQTGYILFDIDTTLFELRNNYEMMKKYSWTICKGIFTEMYAGKGTLYTKMLQNKGLTKGDPYLENYNYEINDIKAKQVYKALKNWHIKHMKIYDMVIDPIIKPKALSDEGMAAFYNLYMEIRIRDLGFMGEILDRVEIGIEDKTLDEFVNDSLEKCRGWFEVFGIEVEKLYNTEEIVYNAVENPFMNKN